VDSAGRFRSNTLTTRRVVFLLIAAASPMASMVANVPLALVYGNGVSLPAMFFISMIVMLCFSVGYAAMSRRVVNTGAFYTYVARGIGPAPAISAAYLAVVSYTALSLGNAGAFGYFAHVVLHTAGVEVAWEWPSALALLVVAALGYRSAALSARVVAVLLLVEFVALFTMNGGILVHKKVAALPLASLSPHEFMAGSIGIGLVFALTSFTGFETGALYGEETADPRRSVARATYITVLVIGVFYIVTSWLVVGAVGATNARAQASHHLGLLLFQIATDNVSPLLADVMGVLMCTGMLASMLAVHNAASRYLFALGRDRVLPSVLARYHSRHLSPHVASLTVSATGALVVLAFAVAGLDPYLTLATSMVGLATLGVVLLQVFAAIAVVVFFLRRREGNYLRTVLAPAAGGVGLAVAFCLTAVHFRTLVGTTNPVVANLPWLLGGVVLAGFGAGWWMRGRRRGSRHRVPTGVDTWTHPQAPPAPVPGGTAAGAPPRLANYPTVPLPPPVEQRRGRHAVAGDGAAALGEHTGQHRIVR
jgi:amino acid transporter